MIVGVGDDVGVKLILVAVLVRLLLIVATQPP